MVVFSVLCYNFFSWRFAGAPSETSRPRFSVRSITRAARRLAIIYHRYDNLYCLWCTLLGCTPRGRSFAYMWGAGLRAHLKFSAQRGKICTQRARQGSALWVNRSTRHKERVLVKERNRSFRFLEFEARGVRKVTTGITGLWQPRVHIDVAF